jgi:hypothetical protein
MVRLEGKSGAANSVEGSVGPLFERARTLRRDAARLVRQLARTSEEITAHTKRPEELRSRPKNSDPVGEPAKEKPR